MFLLMFGAMFYVIVIFFYILFQDFKHVLSKSTERFDLVHAMLLGLIWPIIFATTMVGVVSEKLGIEDED